MELREQIFVKICEASVGIGPEQLDATKLADAILDLPEIREALRVKAVRDGKVGYERQG